MDGKAEGLNKCSNGFNKCGYREQSPGTILLECIFQGASSSLQLADDVCIPQKDLVQLANIAQAMGHTIEVHLSSYARFTPMQPQIFMGK